MHEVIVNEETIQKKIFTIRGKQVMIDRDLAEMYGVETRVFNQAVKRNIARFPESFRFQLTEEEYKNLRSQFVTSSSGHGGRRHLPYVFTEQGVSMLSAVLKSERAIEVYHICASLKDLGKKRFAFSKIDKECLCIMERLGYDA